MMKYRGRHIRFRTEITNYGTWTYVIQTDLKTPAGYRVFRLDSHTGAVRIVCSGVTLKEARKAIPKNEFLAPVPIL